MAGWANGALPKRPSPLARAAMSIAAVLAAAALRFALAPLFAGPPTLLLLALAVLVAARFGGVAAGLLATALCGAFEFFVTAPGFGSTYSQDLTVLGLFAAVGTGISVLSGQLRYALEASAEAAEHRRILTETGPQLIWSCDPEGRCDYLNARWVEYTGIPASERFGFRWIEQVHPDDRDAVLDAWTDAVNTGREFRTEFRIRRADGGYRWFETRAVALRDKAGRPMKWIGSCYDIHEAREAREALRLEQERLTNIVATAPGVIYSFRLRPDGSTSFPYASPRIAEVFGVEPRELVDDSGPVCQRMHPDDVAPVCWSTADSARTMTPWREQFRVRNPSRGEIWVEAYSQPARQPDGSIEWHGFLADITERRRIEEELRSGAAALEELTRTLDLAHVMVKSLDGAITYWSEGAASMYGWSREEAVGRRSHELLRTEFPSSLSYEDVQAALLARGRWEGELTHYRRDGTPVEVASHWALHTDAAGRPCSVIEVNNDISEQKRVERELRASEERLALAQAAAGIGSWDWHIAEDETLCSTAYGALYGLPPGVHAPSPAEWIHLIHPEDRERVRRALRRALSGGAAFDMEFRIVTPDGRVRWLMGKGQVHRDASGRAARMVGVTLDVTERKQAAEQLRALSASLISAQEEERRRISRELHDDLVQRLGLMAIDVGKLISRPPLPRTWLLGELRSLQERAVQAAELTRHIAHELHPLILDELGIATALRSLCEEVARRDEIEVGFVPGDLPQGIGREIASCLYAVAQEALLNVSKHARAAHVEVSVSGGPKLVRLSIVDDGVGAPAGSAAGLGLGMVNMRERVRWVGGVFSFDSTPGQGSRLTVEIPLEEKSA